jgi:hypothetical protein
VTNTVAAVPRKITSKWTYASDEAKVSSADDRVQITFFRRLGSQASLESTFAAEQAETPNRHVSYRFPRQNIAQADFFVVAGEMQGRSFNTRAFGRKGDVRGFTASWDEKAFPGFEKMVVAMAADFDPFPSNSIIAALRKPDTGTPHPPTATESAEPPPKPMATTTPTRASTPSTTREKSAVIGTGFFISADGQAIIPKSAANCQRPSAGGFGLLTITNKSVPGPVVIARAEQPPSDFVEFGISEPKPTGSFYVVASTAINVGGADAEPSIDGAPLSPGSGESKYVIASALPPSVVGAPVIDAMGDVVGIVSEAPVGTKGDAEWRPGPYNVEALNTVMRRIAPAEIPSPKRSSSVGAPYALARNVFAVLCQQ